MRVAMADIFSLVCGIAGWYYLFYSKAAGHLANVETHEANIRRVRLRRTCGAALVLLAASFFIGVNAVDPQQTPRLFLSVWLVTLVLLGSIVILAMADLRLTIKLRDDMRKERKKP
jgi:peptidoglycan/LPS O-acetylase OafA/YrhL